MVVDETSPLIVVELVVDWETSSLMMVVRPLCPPWWLWCSWPWPLSVPGSEDMMNECITGEKVMSETEDQRAIFGKHTDICRVET
jgi:hypothetical protein